MNTSQRHWTNHFFTRVLATGFWTATAITLLLSLTAFQAKANLIRAAVVVEQSAQAIAYDTQENPNAGPGDTVNAKASYVIKSCPLCSDGGLKGTTQASVITTSGSISATGNYLFSGNPGNSAFWSGFTQSGRFLIDQITITYRGIDPKAQLQNTVFADLHMTANGNFIGNSLGIGVFAWLNGQMRQDTLATGSFSNQLVNFQNYTLPVNQVFTMDVSASVLTRSIFQQQRNAHVAVANWNLKLGGSPAFILPEGFYANSADGRIVNNYFVDSSAPQNVTEPSVWILMSMALGLALQTRRQLS